MLTIEIADRQNRVGVDCDRLKCAVEQILRDADVSAATVSIAIVEDPAIHELNRRFLDHDEPTDVISFVLSEDGCELEGDIAVSADAAARSAEHFGWSPADELLLYIIHGTLHLVGYDDLDPQSKRLMRDREGHYLAKLGLTHRYDDRSPHELGTAVTQS